METKKKLLTHCQQQVERRYNEIKRVIAGIEEALMEETKSSSGDKHETGRAMLQIERENAGKQLFEVEKLMVILPRIDVRSTSDYVRLGSLVRTDAFHYFISLSLGSVTIADTDYLCVALNSPIGTELRGKRSGETFVFNQKEYRIESVE